MASFANSKGSWVADAIRPSAGGLIYYLVASISILIVSNSSGLHRFIYGSGDLGGQDKIFWVSVNEQISSWLGFRGSDAVAVYAFWAIVGLLIYALLHYVSLVFNELIKDIKLRHYIWPKDNLKDQPLKRFFIVAAIRVAIFIVTFTYIKKIAEFMFRPIESFWASSSWISNNFFKYFLVFSLYVLLLHGLTILVRVLVMKRRVFS